MTHLQRLRDKIAASQRLFEAMDDRGGDHDALHTIEHHFIAAEKNTLNELTKTAEFLGFGSGDVADGEGPDGTPYCHVDVLSRVPILSEDYSVFITPAREAAVMLQLADAHNAEYDGWGTKLIKK